MRSASVSVFSNGCWYVRVACFRLLVCSGSLFSVCEIRVMDTHSYTGVFRLVDYGHARDEP